MELGLSAEAQQMASKERRRWLTVAEAQSVREKWESSRDAVDKACERFDGNPEDETDAQLFLIMSAMMIDGFVKDVRKSLDKLTAMINEAQEEKDG